MNEYIVLDDGSQMILVNEVNKYLAKGWKCQGGVAVAVWDNNDWYYQAMIKERQEDSKQRSGTAE
jgi:hypothetical protein